MSILKIEPQVSNSLANFSFGNVFAGNYFYSNGVQFVGGGGGSGTVKYTADTTPPISNNSPGDQWFDTTAQVLYEYINDGTSNAWVDIISPTFSSATPTTMTNGNSNISIQTNGNINLSAIGTSNVLTVSNVAVTVTGNIQVTSHFVGNLVGNTVIVSNGLYSTTNYTGAYTDGIVVDYITGTGRISVGASDGISFYKNGVGGTQLLGIDSNGNASISGALTVTGSTLLTGATTIQLTSEIYSSKTAATGVVSHDLSASGTFYHTNPAANFTVNFVNVPTTASRIIVVSLIVEQAATPYMPTAVQIEGVAQTIKWINGSVPTGNASKTDIVSFSLQRSNTVWIVYGQSASYG